MQSFLVEQTRWFAALCLAGALSACSSDPVYRTHYDLTAPATETGRQCTVGCETNRLLCEQRNDDRIARCEEQADRAYNNCTEDLDRRMSACISGLKSQYGSRWATYESHCTATVANTCYRQSCDTESSCDGGYRACFSNCGGEVKTRSVCVRNCDASPGGAS
jgi:hypothetical protein